MRTRPTGSCERGDLPVNVDPLDPEDRRPRGARSHARAPFERGLSTPTGFVLPVQRWNARRPRAGWRSERWPLRRGTAVSRARQFAGRASPAAELAAVGAALDLSLYHRAGSARAARAAAGREIVASAASSRRRAAARAGPHRAAVRSKAAVRTALTVEPRDGVICVFMPPVETLEDYLELLAAVEARGSAPTCRCASRAIRRRSIRGSTSSR